MALPVILAVAGAHNERRHVAVDEKLPLCQNFFLAGAIALEWEPALA